LQFQKQNTTSCGTLHKVNRTIPIDQQVAQLAL
jgi:hypothetical protein